jgi:hypothetical protein
MIQVAGQPVLQAVQTALKAGFILRRDRCPKAQPRSELLRRKMLHTRDLLLDALRLEQDLSEGGGLEQWRACCTMVDNMAQDYASAVAAWCEAVEEDFPRAGVM